VKSVSFAESDVGCAERALGCAESVLKVLWKLLKKQVEIDLWYTERLDSKIMLDILAGVGAAENGMRDWNENEEV